MKPTIGNYNQEFVDMWYSKLKTSLTLMKDIAAHCDKTIVKTEDSIKDTETHLKKYNRKIRIPEHWKNHKKQWSKHQKFSTTKKVQKVQLFEIKTKFNNRGNTATN